MEYLIECFKSAREESLIRIKYRDSWLKIQFLSQIILIAIALGIEILGIKSLKDNSWLMFLSLPISLIICFLYYIEDNLIGILSGYIASLSQFEHFIDNKSYTILNYDIAYHMIHAGNTFIFLKKFRLIGNILSFTLLPSITTIYILYMFYNNNYDSILSLKLIIVLLLINLLSIFALCWYGYMFRKKIGNDNQIISIIPKTT